ncbi:MAG: hypothetical protein IT336_14385 [Thermomicrobiales bacterium]|nr:hypothetical protein [Thermomicrobiales bacterium]
MPVAFVNRFRQGLTALSSRIPADRDRILADALTPELSNAFLKLPIYDQQHLCAVYRRLIAGGHDDPDLLQAALLHDLGKCALGGRVRIFHRVIVVLLGRVAPSWLARLADLPAPRWRRGVALAVHHPRLGADWARQLGCSERTCWLIAHHADDPPPADEALRLLIDADDRSV